MIRKVTTSPIFLNTTEVCLWIAIPAKFSKEILNFSAKKKKAGSWLDNIEREDESFYSLTLLF